ncbi:MAG: transglutaminase family protein, partial [Chloroflexota bacterium]
MYYAITHLTMFTYDEPVWDTVMEVREQPRNDKCQRCIQFDLDIRPKATYMAHKDYLGNVIHIFDIPGRHKKLAIRTEATVEVKPPEELPEALTPDDWDILDAEVDPNPDLLDMIMPSKFARPSALLDQLKADLKLERHADPLTLVRELNTAIYDTFDYIQNVTAADSPIEIALEKRLGVCQDFAHIMIALLRELRIPARYISGYLYHRTDKDRSAADATHAWVEVWLPELGWVGFDPTNNLVCNEQHIRVAIGRDYADVPPTKGVFRGDATSTLEVEVEVSKLDALPAEEEIHAPRIVIPQYELMPQHQQQQQQQQ